jgi:putative ubiquitin-RnfH superfamily antitoxin RatB of RatAB toxin-antitoxin module
MTPAAPGSGSKRCTVAYATRERQHLWHIELPLAASVADALAAARACAAASGEDAGIPWESAAVGIFGEPCVRSDRCADGDRIELYRPLRRDPRERRRERVQRERRAGRTGTR